jgi:hypothetical protein
MENTSCTAALATLRELEAFLDGERSRVSTPRASGVARERESFFLGLAHDALTSCVPENLKELLSEFRGTGHYLGAYVTDQKRLDGLLDSLYAACASAYAELRTGNTA